MTYEKQMLEHLTRKFIEHEESIKEQMGSGTPKDFTEYKNLCGVIQGLRRARMEIQDLVQRYEEFEND